MPFSFSPDVKRDPVTQRYDDEYLAGVLQRATSVHAGAFRVIGRFHQGIDDYTHTKFSHRSVGTRYRTCVILNTHQL